MDGLLIACGSGFALMGLAGLISLVSEKRRRTAKAMGTSPAMIFSVVGVGGLFVAAGMVHSGWLYLMGVVALYSVAAWGRKARRGLADPPPYFARLDAMPVNPLRRLAHPVETAKGHAEAWKVRRNRREAKEWKRRQGLD